MPVDPTQDQGSPPPASRELTFGERFRHGPLTAGIAVFCAGLFVVGMSRPELFERGVMVPDAVWGGEVWRLLTANFFHVNFMHVAFNVLWWWQLGFAVEVRYGSARLLLLTVITGVAGSLAELSFAALDYPGSVGLSGAVYGIFTFGFVALRPLGGPFGMLFSKKNAQVFLGWGLLCVVLTVANILPVANFAHGAGAGFGALLGLAWSRLGGQRLGFSLASLGLLAGLAVAGMNPFWTARRQAFLASQAFDARDWKTASGHYQAVVDSHPEAHWIRANLALVLAHQGRDAEAVREARALPESYVSAIKGMNQQLLLLLRQGGESDPAAAAVAPPDAEASPPEDSGVGSTP